MACIDTDHSIEMSILPGKCLSDAAEAIRAAQMAQQYVGALKDIIGSNIALF